MEGFTGGKYNIVETLSENRAFRVIDMNKHQYFLKRFEPGDVSYDDEKRNLGSVVCPYVPALIESFEDESGNCREKQQSFDRFDYRREQTERGTHCVGA